MQKMMVVHVEYTRQRLILLKWRCTWSMKTGDSRLTLERTYGGEGLRYAGSSADRGREVDTSMTVVVSLNVRDIVTASLGLHTRSKCGAQG